MILNKTPQPPYQADIPKELEPYIKSTRLDGNHYVAETTDIPMGVIAELVKEHPSLRGQLTVSRRQFFLGITFFQHNGSPLKRQIEALIDNLEDPQKTIVKTEYQQASSFDRLNPSVLAIAEALEISEQTMDEFFDYCLNEKWG